MYKQILLQAIMVLVVNGPEQCMWELEDCRTANLTDPDYWTHCYKEYSRRSRLCRDKCVGPRPYSPKCMGYCGEFVTKCLGEGKASMFTVPPYASSTNATGTLATSNKKLSNASGSESQTTGLNSSFTTESGSSEATQNLSTESVSLEKSVVVVAGAVICVIVMSLVIRSCQKRRANKNGQTSGSYEAVRHNDVTDPPPASQIEETTV